MARLIANELPLVRPARASKPGGCQTSYSCCTNRLSHRSTNLTGWPSRSSSRSRSIWPNSSLCFLSALIHRIESNPQIRIWKSYSYENYNQNELNDIAWYQPGNPEHVFVLFPPGKTRHTEIPVDSNLKIPFAACGAIFCHQQQRGKVLRITLCQESRQIASSSSDENFFYRLGRRRHEWTCRKTSPE